jgi:YegS/Rv2252/BmrU family lipid kinase
VPGTVVIINPRSGPQRRGRGSERVDAAKRAIDRLGVAADIRVTERAGHAHDLALDAAASGAELVVAWGGDGTINEVARALVQRDEAGAVPPALGIIPGGSGNGLSRELRIPFDPAHAIERALRSPVRHIDVGEIGEHLFFNVAGIGLDAHVAALVTTRVHHRGLLPYLTATAGDLIHYRPGEYVIDVAGATKHVTALVLACANSRQWGFGAQIAPGSNLEDGLIEFVIVEDRGFVGNAVRVPALFLGRIDRQRGVETHRVREVTIRSREPMLFHVDGEAKQGSDTLTAHVHPRALRLRA